jgi:hypothetical protein
VFDLHSNHDAIADADADAEKAKADDDGGVDQDNEIYASGRSSTPLNWTAPLIYFPTSSSSSSLSVSGEVAAAAEEGEGLVVPMADGPRKKPFVLHSPHSSYSDVLAIHDQRLYAVSGKSIVGNTRHDTTRTARHDTHDLLGDTHVMCGPQQCGTWTCARRRRSSGWRLRTRATRTRCPASTLADTT